MPWKKKEKKLTKEEALSLARDELKEFWFHSKPLLVGVKNKEGYSAHPLDEEILNNRWFIFFLDPAILSFRRLIDYIRVWRTRYEQYDIKSLYLINPPYQSFLEKDAMKQLINRYEIKAPIGVDRGGAIAQAFNLTKLPKFVFLLNGKPVINCDGEQWTEMAEKAIQDFLRTEDPGLPLEPPYVPKTDLMSDIGAIELNPASENVTFSKEDLSVSEAFKALQNQEDEQITFYGKWKRLDEGVLCEDSSAFVTLKSKGTLFSIIAKSPTSKLSKGRISVDIDGSPVFDTFSAEHLRTDENGETSMDIIETQLYHALRDLPPDPSYITLRFPSAHRVPVHLFGFRFSS